MVFVAALFDLFPSFPFFLCFVFVLKMKRAVEELLSRELALTLSTQGARLHAQIFNGQELFEGHAEVPVSLELVAMLEEYERGAEEADKLESRIRAHADSIVREMKGDRVSKTLTDLFVGRQSSSQLQYYVNWRAVVIKLHALLLRVDGLDEILELHRPGSRVRKQVSLASHPTRDLLRSKEMLPSQKSLRNGPVFHQPSFRPIRAVSRSSVVRASEQERKAELLRSAELPKSISHAVSDPRFVSPSRVLPSSDEADASPASSGLRRRASISSGPVPAAVPSSGAGIAPHSAAAASSSSSSSAAAASTAAAAAAAAAAVDSPFRRPSSFSDLVAEDSTELSASLPSRYESHFMSAGPIPPARLTEAIKLRGDKFAPPVKSANVSASPAPVQTPAEVAPPFRTNLASLEQLITVQPAGRFAQHETQDPPPRVKQVFFFFVFFFKKKKKGSCWCLRCCVWGMGKGP